MKRAHLHLVEDNTPREAIRVTPAEAAEIDFRALAARGCKPKPQNMLCSAYSAICGVQEYVESPAWEPYAPRHFGSHRSAYSGSV